MKPFDLKPKTERHFDKRIFVKAEVIATLGWSFCKNSKLTTSMMKYALFLRKVDLGVVSPTIKTDIDLKPPYS